MFAGHVEAVNNLFAHAGKHVNAVDIGFNEGWRHALEEISDDAIRSQAAADVAKFTRLGDKQAVAKAYSALSGNISKKNQAQALEEVRQATSAHAKLNVFARFLFLEKIANKSARAKAIAEFNAANTMNEKEAVIMRTWRILAEVSGSAVAAAPSESKWKISLSGCISRINPYVQRVKQRLLRKGEPKIANGWEVVLHFAALDDIEEASAGAA